MKKLLSIILSALILMLIMISPASAELKNGSEGFGKTKTYYKYEDSGDFRYKYYDWGLCALYKKRSSKEEISRIEFPAEYKGKKVDKIGFTTHEDDSYACNLKVNTIFIPKTIKDFYIQCVDYVEYDGEDRFISVRNIEVDKDNPYLCSKDGVLYSKDMKTLCLYPDRNSMTVYKMPNSVIDDSSDFFGRDNLRKVYLSDKLKFIYGISYCNLEYVSIGKEAKRIYVEAFVGDPKLKTVKIKSKKLKEIMHHAFSCCFSLKNINIPSTVKKIDECAFIKCKSMKKITLSRDLKKLGNSVFSQCKNLSKVTFKSAKKSPYIGKNAFKNTKKGIKFVVKNKKIAKQLKKQLKESGVRNARILVGKKVVYQNING